MPPPKKTTTKKNNKPRSAPLVRAPIERTLMTADEAADYLLLEGANGEPVNGKTAMDHLVDRKCVRPTLVNNRRRYLRKELDLFLDDQTM